MIPFLPEDAVVDKKKDSYTSTESGIHYKGAVQSQGFSPPAAFVGMCEPCSVQKWPYLNILFLWKSVICINYCYYIMD